MLVSLFQLSNKEPFFNYVVQMLPLIDHLPVENVDRIPLLLYGKILIPLKFPTKAKLFQEATFFIVIFTYLK